MTGHGEFNWQRLLQQARAFLNDTRNRVSNAANLSALLYLEVPDISWAGFYFLDGERLLVGPFQGKPACVSIELGKGVCGSAAAQRRTICVPDVDAFDGHIACDAAARSEVVVPLEKNGALIGVLDVDSARPDRFGAVDVRGLEDLAQAYLAASD